MKVGAPTSVTPALHGRFMQWIGNSGKIREAMPLEDWCTATAKRFSIKEWRSRAANVGLKEGQLPAQRDALLSAMLGHMMRSAAGAMPQEEEE